MNLSGAEIGKTYEIKKIELSEDKKSRLLDLGLTKGTKIEVVNFFKNGPMIVSVRGRRLAMGREYILGIVVLEMEL